MIKKIAYENKVAIQNDEEIARKNKVTDADLNEIKEVVNNNADEITGLKQQTEQAVEDINTDIEDIKQEQTEQNANIQKNTTDILNLDTNKASKAELQEATLALQAELLKAQEEIERQNKDYEAGTLEGQAEGESLYLQDSSDARFREFGIGGNDKQATRSGINFYNANDKLNFSDVVVVDKDDWITITGDNSSGNSLLFKNFMTKNNKNIKSNTTYYLVVEIKNIAGEGRIILASASASEVEGAIKTSVGIDFSDLSTGKKVCSVTTKENLESLNNPSLLRSYVQFKAGQSGSITFRMSLLEAEPTLSTFEYEPYGAMPSLEFPSFVQAVGQDVNKLDMSAFEDKVINGVEVKRNEAGEFNIIGTATNNITIDINITEINLKGTHTLSTNKTGDITSTDVAAVQFLLYDTTNNRVMFNSQIVKNKLVEENYTFAETIAIGKARIYIAKGTILDCKLSFKLQEKSKATAYSPYSYGSASVVVENKNKLDFSKWNNISASHGTVEQVENGIKLTATADDCYTNTFAYKFSEILNKEKIENYGDVAKPNTKYTFSCKVDNVSISKRLAIFFADKDGNSISYVTASTSTLTAITPANCRYITTRVSVVNAGDSLTFTDLQLEEDQATDYVEHEEQTFTIDVQQEMLEGDYFDLDNMEEVHTWGKVIFDGTENWAKSINTNNILFYIPDIFPYKDGTILCNYFKAKDVWDKDVIGIQLYPVNGVRFGLGVNSSIDTVDKWKAKLQELYNAGNPLTIYYKLAEPTRLPFTAEQKAIAKQIRETLHSYKGGTHVYSVDEISPIFNARYTKDLNAVINNLSQEAIGGN